MFGRYGLIIVALQLLLFGCYQKSEEKLSPSVLGAHKCELVEYCDESYIVEEFGSIGSCVEDQTSYYETEADRMIDEGGSSCVDLLYQHHQCEIEFEWEAECDFTVEEWSNSCSATKHALYNCLNKPSA